jgi:hypothetical protein
MHRLAEGRIFHIEPGGIYGYQWVRNGYVKDVKDVVSEKSSCKVSACDVFQQRTERCQVMTKTCLCFCHPIKQRYGQNKGKVASLMPDLLLDYTDTK